MTTQSDTRELTAWTHGPIADLYSSYAAAAAVSTAFELDLLEKLKSQGAVPYGNGGDNRLNSDVLRNIYTTLSWAKIVTIKDGRTVVPGLYFDDAYEARGFFYWLVRGSGGVLRTAPDLAQESNRTGDFCQRDMRAVAIASRLMGQRQVECLLDEAVAAQPVKKVADLGCGSGHRMIHLAQTHPDIECVGLDIAEDAVSLAAETIRSLGLSDRVSVHQADARNLKPEPEYADVDTIISVFMGHDCWPHDDFLRSMDLTRSAFPATKRMLLCDVTRGDGSPGPQTGIFTVGYEAVHALMGVYLPTLSEWEDAFGETSWNCQKIIPMAVPPNGFLAELVPADLK